MKFAMNDSRPFTDYRSNCIIIGELEKKSGAQTAYDLRQYLQKNAEKVMYQSRNCNYKKVCPVCKKMILSTN